MNNYQNKQPKYGSLGQQIKDAGKYFAFAAGLIVTAYFAELQPRWEAEKVDQKIDELMQESPGCPDGTDAKNIESLLE